jgi:hypothetical protein
LPQPDDSFAFNERGALFTQMERIDAILEKKQRILDFYTKRFGGLKEFVQQQSCPLGNRPRFHRSRLRVAASFNPPASGLYESPFSTAPKPTCPHGITISGTRFLRSLRRRVNGFGFDLVELPKAA